MSKSGILSVHLGLVLKERWSGYCKERRVSSSAAMRQVVIKLTSSAANSSSTSSVISEQPDRTRRRVELRLTGSEFEAIAQRAEFSGLSENAWIVNLIRANLTKTPQLGFYELQTLGESNTRLQAIGRNLNQIARWMNGNRGSAALELERIEQLYRLITVHTEQVTAAMRANIDRWALK